MSLILICLFAAFVAYLFSQFGGRLSARNSLIWWLVFAFLMFGAIWPGGLVPVAHALGIQLVSNFVLATMTVFLVFQAVQESTVSTMHARKLRELVCHGAAREYLQRHKTQAGSAQKDVLVILPCYNEEHSLPDVISRLQALQSDPRYRIHVCVVNDGSIDRTEQILHSKLPDGYAHHAVNVGVSGALLTGFKIVGKAGFDFAVQCDADGQHPIERIPELVAEADLKGLDLVVGSRFIEETGSNLLPKIVDDSTTVSRRMGSLLVIAILKAFSKVGNITDPTSGFRAYSRKACLYLARTMPDEYPEPESIAVLAIAGAKIGELPVKMAPRKAGVSSLAGLKGFQFMLKVTTALLGLRLRTLGRAVDLAD